MRNTSTYHVSHLLLPLLLALLPTIPALADDDVRRETRVEQTRARFGLTGDGVIVAILDRGIDYEHPDFRHEDGTSRILYILDLTDDTGANDPDNTAGVGTVYTKAEIDAALSSGNRLATRDAVGHGTTTAGLAGGNGRASDGLYAGMAPGASFIIVKYVTESVPAHDGEPAQEGFFQPSLFPVALDFVLQKAEQADMPLVALGNFGSIGEISDGTTAFARAIDDRFGPGKPGRVFVTGTSDDGGAANHAAGAIGAGETIDVRFRKGHAGNLRLQFWYDGADRLDVEILSPSGTFGPYVSPATNAERDDQQTSVFRYYHNGSTVDFAQATSNTREILIDFSGPVGDYVLRLTGEAIADGRFDAWLNPSRFGSFASNRFENFVVPGYTIHQGAASINNVAPNSYVLRHEWTDVDGVRRSVSNEGAIGDLWKGSGIGPTTDGRYGVTVSAPGERLFAPYAPRSLFATFRGNVVFDDGEGGLYGLQSAVSAANPVVTGIIALMLEADPTLDAAEVKDILQRTARRDAFTGAVPNNEWGYGKIDALAAVADVLGVAANAAPSAAQITTPAPGIEMTIGGASGDDPLAPSTPFIVGWSEADDPEGEAVTYTWQLATGQDFSTGMVLSNVETGTTAQYETTLEALAMLLDGAGVALGSSIRLFHQVIASDGSIGTMGPAASITLVRGTLVGFEEDTTLPRIYSLAQNHPNPFNPRTTIGFSLPQAMDVRLAVYDMLGREVARLVEGTLRAGRHETGFEAKGLPTGLYIYRLQAGTFSQSRRMLLVK